MTIDLSKAKSLTESGLRRGLLSAPKPLIPVRVPVLMPAKEVSAAQCNLIAINIDGNAFILTSEAAHTLRGQLDKAMLSPTTNAEIAVFDVLLSTFGVSQKAIQSRGRKQPVAIIRQIGFWLLRNVAGLSWSACGDTIGGSRPFDHGTAIHGVNTVERRMQSDPEFRSAVERARRNMETVLVRPSQTVIEDAQ